MALGGGNFLTQGSKVLPGAYFNFVGVKSASANLSERGFATMPLELDWGVEGEVFTVTQGDFQKNSLKIFGYPYTADELKGLRDLFLYTNVLYAYRLNGGGTKASNDFATAKYGGTRGNAIKIAIQTNLDDEDLFDVITYIDTTKVDEQSVESASDLIDNDYVTFKSDAELSITAGTPLANGTNSTVSGTNYQTYLEKIEAYNFNVMGVVTTDTTTKGLIASFVKRMRETVGKNFVTVLYAQASDYEGSINVKNKTLNDGWSDASLVYWVTGVQAGCAVNKSLTNKKYDGEFTVDVPYTQMELEDAIKGGEFTFHRVNDDIRILTDINSLVTTTLEKTSDFKKNQTIRVLDQIANDIAVKFAEDYLGKIPNDDAGRTSFWADIVKHHEALQDLRAIQNFSDKDVIVEQGDSKDSVVVSDSIEVVNAMEKLFMTVYVS